MGYPLSFYEGVHSNKQSFRLKWEFSKRGLQLPLGCLAHFIDTIIYILDVYVIFFPSVIRIPTPTCHAEFMTVILIQKFKDDGGGMKNSLDVYINF